MIVEKTWERLVCDPKGIGGRTAMGKNYIDTYRGWFLLGVLPLYIRRERVRR